MAHQQTFRTNCTQNSNHQESKSDVLINAPQNIDFIRTQKAVTRKI
jgi:hypothetical protein